MKLFRPFQFTLIWRVMDSVSYRQKQTICHEWIMRCVWYTHARCICDRTKHILKAQLISKRTERRHSSHTRTKRVTIGRWVIALCTSESRCRSQRIQYKHRQPWQRTVQLWLIPLIYTHMRLVAPRNKALSQHKRICAQFSTQLSFMMRWPRPRRYATRSDK